MEKKPISAIDRTLFIYSSKHLSGSKKVRFFYALKGRGKENGLVNGNSIISLSKKVLLVSSSKKSEVESFLNYWACPYTKISASQLKKYSLLKYDSSNLKPKDQVRFFYALKGRNSSPGILKSTNSKQLAKGLILIPMSKKKQLHSFFDLWNCKTMEVNLDE